MKTREIIEAAREWVMGAYSAFSPSSARVMRLLMHLAERVAALEAREETRERIKPITEGRKPEPGVGR